MQVLPYRPPGAAPGEVPASVAAELQFDERLLWAGSPARGWYTLRSFSICVVGLVVVGSGLVWRWRVASMGTGIPRLPGGGSDVFSWFPFIGNVVTGGGAALLLSPAWFFWRACTTCYAVTDRRAIVVRRGLLGGTSCESYGPPALQQMFRRQWAARRGDLIFDERTVGSGEHRRTIRHGFLSVDRVAEVENLIRRELL